MLNVLLCYLFKYNELVTYFIMIDNINYLWQIMKNHTIQMHSRDIGNIYRAPLKYSPLVLILSFFLILYISR
jgi:hypothetical protein